MITALNYNPKLYEPCTKKPPLTNAQIELSPNIFKSKIILPSKIQSNSKQYNLTKIQRRILKQLYDNQQIMILNSDANLGIILNKRDEYIKAIQTE